MIPLLLHQNVEIGYNTTVVHFERANTDVDPHVLKNRNQISENDTSSSERLKYDFFFYLFVVQPELFYPMLDFN